MLTLQPRELRNLEDNKAISVNEGLRNHKNNGRDKEPGLNALTAFLFGTGIFYSSWLKRRRLSASLIRDC